MGTPKALLPIAGTTFVRHMAQRFIETGIDKILITVPECEQTAHRIQSEFIDTTRIAFSRNLFPVRELLGSVQTAILKSEDAQALMIMPVDVPAPSAELLCAFLKVSQHAIICASHQRMPAHPFLLDASLFDEVLALGPADSLRTVIARHRVTYIESDDTNLTLNINTPEDYARFANPSLK